jgi:acyl-CoA reductase-like NAD-dependent aldehyde dehydrogenase
LADLLLEECGLPPGWISVVTGGGTEVGGALVEHPDIAMITFTGSPEVGWGIRERAPRKRVGLELGNNAPVIIEADGDWQGAAAKIKLAGFSHAGQSCISTQRVYVHRNVYDAFLDELAGHVATLVVGDPLDEGTDVSALISPGDTERVKSWVDDAVASGARVVAGGEVDGRGVLAPTVLAEVDPDMKVCREEVFGPVVTISPYQTFDDAIASVNDSRFGLQAGVFTNDINRAFQAHRDIEVGGVIVNDVSAFRADQMPYGGSKDSGFGREGLRYAMEEMTEPRIMVLSHVPL